MSEGLVSNTRFLVDPFTSTVDGSSVFAYKLVAKQVKKAELDLRHVTASDGELLQFDTMTLHKAVPATKPGRRLFFRMSMCLRPVDRVLSKNWDSASYFSRVTSR